MVDAEDEAMEIALWMDGAEDKVVDGAMNGSLHGTASRATNGAVDGAMTVIILSARRIVMHTVHPTSVRGVAINLSIAERIFDLSVIKIIVVDYNYCI